MMTLTTLPTELVGISVFSFLEMTDLVQLEASYVKHDDRIRILDALHCASPLNLSACKVNSSFMLNWALSKGLRVCGVDIACKHDLILDKLVKGNCVLANGLRINLICADLCPIQKIQQCSQSILGCINRLSISRIDDTSPSGSLLEPVQIMPGVQVLDLDIGSKGNVTVTNIFRACPNIVKLHIGTASALLSLILPDQLCMVGSRLLVFEWESYRLDQVVLDAVGQYCPQLQNLLLNNSDPFESGIAMPLNLNPVASGCHQLQEVILVWLAPVAGSLAALFASCRGLRKLSMSSTIADNTVLSAMTPSCTTLQSLNLRWGVTDTEMVAAASHVWENLRSLTVSCLTSDTRCNESLAMALGYMYNLQELALTLFPSASGRKEILECIAVSCTCLVSLTLVGVRHDDSVATLCTIAENCATLKHFVVDWFVQAPDAVMAALGRNCRLLETFSAKTDVGVTDAGVILLAQGCRWLRRLSLPQCKSLTDATLTALVHNCPHLQSVEFPRCENFSEAAVVQWVKSARKLYTLRLHRSAISIESEKVLRQCKGDGFQFIISGDKAEKGRKRCQVS